MVMQQAELMLKREAMLQEIYRKIIRSRFTYVFKRKGIKKDLLVGFIGERGGGKSASASVLSFIDFDLDGIPVFSNMNIGFDVKITQSDINRFASEFNKDMHAVPPGIYYFRSRPLDLAKLLMFDEEYRGSCMVVDEVNVEFSEARRSMTNTNLLGNRIVQELRHYEAAMVFTCISEMFIDARLRESADLFVKCHDLANSTSGIAQNKLAGEQFQWIGYLMSSCWTGETYYDTHKANFEAVFTFRPWQGIHSTLQYQGQNMTKFGVDLKRVKQQCLPVMDIKESPTVDNFREKWGWLADMVEQWKNKGMIEVSCQDFWKAGRIEERGIYKNLVSQVLKDYFNVKVIRHWDGPTPENYYAFDTTPGDEVE